jgi:hypothetical protein
LKDDFPKRAMFLTRSESSSDRLSSLFIKFLRIEISKVGRELLFVISWLGSSDFPLDNTLAKTLRAD